MKPSGMTSGHGSGAPKGSGTLEYRSSSLLMFTR